MYLLNRPLPPIAMLHSVSDNAGAMLKNWCITRAGFLQLLHVIEANNYLTTHFREIVERGNLPAKNVKKIILTFDDCPKHLFDFAIPELLKRKMKAVFYMPTANLGGYNDWDVEKGAARLELMDESDLRQLVDYGMEVGSHSHHHIRLKDIQAPEILEEVTVSKQILESIINKPVYSFAYPYGSVPANYQQVLSAAGYHYAVSIYQPFETALALRRFGVYNEDTTETLSRKLSTRYKWMRKIYDVVKKN